MSTHRACCCGPGNECGMLGTAHVCELGIDVPVYAFLPVQGITYTTSAHEAASGPGVLDYDVTTTTSGAYGFAVQYDRTATDAEVIAEFGLSGYDNVLISGPSGQPTPGLTARVFHAWTENLNSSNGSSLAPGIGFHGVNGNQWSIVGVPGGPECGQTVMAQASSVLTRNRSSAGTPTSYSGMYTERVVFDGDFDDRLFEETRSATVSPGLSIQSLPSYWEGPPDFNLCSLAFPFYTYQDMTPDTEDGMLLLKCDGTPGAIFYRKTAFDALGLASGDVVKIAGVCWRQDGVTNGNSAEVRSPAIESVHPTCSDCSSDAVPCWILERCDGQGQPVNVDAAELAAVPGSGNVFRIAGVCWTKTGEVVAVPAAIRAADIEARFVGCTACDDRPLNVRFDPCTGFGTAPSFYVDQEEYFALADPPAVVGGVIGGGQRRCYHYAARDLEVGDPIAIEAFELLSSFPNCQTCYGPIEPPGPEIRPSVAVTAPPSQDHRNAAIEAAMSQDPLRRCKGCGQ